MKVEALRYRCKRNPELCETIIQREIANNSRSIGFCIVSTKTPSKNDGYIQLSHDGANKFATIQEVLLWSKGERLPDHGESFMHISHLCDTPACLLKEHIVQETPAQNNRRKNCGKLIQCRHCVKFYSACDHQPRCIQYAAPRNGSRTWAEFEANELHR